MRPQRKRIAQNDSDEDTSESDSNGPMVNGGGTITTTLAANRDRRQPKGVKRLRTLIESDDDEATQPNTLGSSDSQRNPSNNTQESDLEQEESSGEETPDSDYVPAADDSTNRKPGRKRGNPPARISPRKKKNRPNYSLKNASTSFQNGASSVGQSNISDKLSKLSQASAKDTLFDSGTVEDLAQKCVYFLLIEDQKKYAIRKKAIITHVFKDDGYSSKLYAAMIVKTNAILMKTFGMELLQLENQKDSYLLINVLKRELCMVDYVELTRTKHQQHGLILYLLTIIFMNGNCITEDELVKALKPLRIDLTSKRPHPVFGDVKKYITNELVKQMYLNYECVNKDPPQYEITWGLRAKEELDKNDLLQFACQIMDDTSPENWILQYKDAEESAM